jgi:hypothetical protein
MTSYDVLNGIQCGKIWAGFHNRKNRSVRLRRSERHGTRRDNLMVQPEYSRIPCGFSVSEYPQ